MKAQFWKNKLNLMAFTLLVLRNFVSSQMAVWLKLRKETHACGFAPALINESQAVTWCDVLK